MLGLLGLMAIPAIAFFALVLCAEAGYLEGLVPIGSLAAVALLYPMTGWRRRLGVSFLVLQLGFFLFVPTRVFRLFMLPNVAEILERQIFMGTMYDLIHQGVGPDEGVLVVTDFHGLLVRCRWHDRAPRSSSWARRSTFSSTSTPP